MVRSTTSGNAPVDTTDVENDVASSPAISPTWIVVREWAASVMFRTTVVPSSLKKVMTTGAADACGLASSRSVLKNPPVAPSAR